MNNSMIKASGLKKSFKSIEVLKDVSFEIQRGQIFALLGSNGAGKTTTIKILSTFLKPDDGSVSVCGYDVVRQPEKVRERISLTGQFAAVDGILTGIDELEKAILTLDYMPCRGAELKVGSYANKGYRQVFI